MRTLKFARGPHNDCAFRGAMGVGAATASIRNRPVSSMFAVQRTLEPIRNRQFWTGGPEMNSYYSRSSAVQGSGRVLVAFLGCMLFLCLPMFAQSFGRILGTVTDQSGGVLAGATVTVIDADRGVTQALMADGAGEYNAPTLLPGKYIVRAE